MIIGMAVRFNGRLASRIYSGPRSMIADAIMTDMSGRARAATSTADMNRDRATDDASHRGRPRCD